MLRTGDKRKEREKRVGIGKSSQMEGLVMVTATEVSNSIASLGQVISGIGTTREGEKVVSVVFMSVSQQ